MARSFSDTFNDDGHNMRFGTDNDFENGQWIGGEFYAEGTRGRRKLTKNDHIYGVFNDEEADGQRVAKRNKADSRPVSFVSAGVTTGAAPLVPTPQAAPAAMDRDSTEYSGQGLGFGDAPPPASADLSQIMYGGSRKPPPPPAGAAKKATAPPKRKAERPDEDFAAFTQHSSIGLKLMRSMGWKEGTGLGPQGTGRINPIEVEVRPKHMALAFSDRIDKNKNVVDDEDEQGPQAAAADGTVEAKKPPGWQKGNESRKKPKTVYTTVAELAEHVASKPKKMMIHDMRGPEVRITSDISAINKDTSRAGPASKMPELQYNVRLLVDLAEDHIQTVDRKLRLERDSLVNIQHERNSLQRQVAHHAGGVSSIQGLLAVVRTAKTQVKSYNLDQLHQFFVRLANEYPKEWTSYKLPHLVPSLVFPKLKEFFASWEPLLHPTHGVHIVKVWKDVLCPDSLRTQSHHPGAEVYTQLVLSTVLPRLRSAVCNQWQPRMFEPCLQLMEAWKLVLSPSLFESLIDQLVFPKIQQEVALWNPRQDTVPVHVWIHPWIQFLGTRLVEICVPIRHKLSAALADWNATDRSALVILEPWRSVFDPQSWDALMLRCIVPKLATAMHTLVVNPAHQIMEPFEAVMSWYGLIPEAALLGLLDTEFFPKFFQVLITWLNAPTPDYGEITRWYGGWKSQFPAELLQNESMRLQFFRALDLLKQHVDQAPGSVVPPGARENLSYMRVVEERKRATRPQTAPARATDDIDLTFKEVVERFAEENDVTFLPKHGSMQEGKQIYTFGKRSVYLDQRMVFLAVQGMWKPITLPDLVALAR